MRRELSLSSSKARRKKNVLPTLKRKYIIGPGRPGPVRPAWENVLSVNKKGQAQQRGTTRVPHFNLAIVLRAISKKTKSVVRLTY